MLAELSGLIGSRDEMNQKLQMAKDEQELKRITDGVERDLRFSLSISPPSQFRTGVIERLLDPDPLSRSSVKVAYAVTKKLLNACVVKLLLPWKEVAPFRRAFWKRLQQLFAEVTGKKPEIFGELCGRPGSVVFQFRIISPRSSDIIARLVRASETAHFRAIGMGRFVKYIKLWEESDGKQYFTIAFVNNV